MRPCLLVASPLLALLAAGCASPTEPAGATTDLYVVDLWCDDGLIVVGEARNVTRRQGYDNQPAFSADGGTILYASRRSAQSDVWSLDLASGRARPLTESGAREYSPQALPDGTGFSAVRVEEDGRQGLWRYGADSGAGAPVELPQGLAVRYYAWIDAQTLAAQVANPDGETQLVVLTLGAAEGDAVVEAGVGRCLVAVPGRRAVSFVHRESPAEWWIKVLDLDRRDVRTVARTLQGREDHVWTPHGALLMASGSRLFRFVPGTSADWEPIADFDGQHLDQISRLAVSAKGDLLVFAAEPAQ